MPIEIKDLSFIYNPGTVFEKTALQDISFSLEAGQIIGLLGKTGSGKSTLLQVIQGLLKPFQGHIYIDGQDTKKLNSRQISRLRQQVGLVFQYPEQQMFGYDVYDEVSFGPRNIGLPDEEVEQRVSEALALMGLDHEIMKNRPVFTLSSGEKRRVAIAGILSVRSPYLLLDEPTAGMDYPGRQLLLGYLRQAKALGKNSIIISSHNLNELAAVCDRIVMLKQGRLVINAEIPSLSQFDEQLQSAGFHLPLQHLLLNRLRQEGWEIPQKVGSLQEAVKHIAAHLAGSNSVD